MSTPEQTIVREVADERKPKTLREALLAFQADPPQVIRDAEAEVKDKQGKLIYTYKFTSIQELLGALRPRLTDLGLLLTFEPGIEDGRPVLRYELIHVPTEQRKNGTMMLIPGGTMQTLGGSISFARRYVMTALFNIAPDVDEDAAAPTPQEAARLARKVGPARAKKMVQAAFHGGLQERLQQAASYVHDSDVGPCTDADKSEIAIRKLTTAEADRLEKWIEENAAEEGEEPDASS